MGEQVRMIAITPLKYRNRRLLPGDDFIAKGPRDGKLLMATGKAKLAPVGTLPAMPPRLRRLAAAAAPTKGQGQTAQQVADDLKALREEYTAKMGKKPFMGWGADELRRRMDLPS